MHLSKFFHTESGKTLMSVILGFGLATLFRSVCKGNNCLIMKAPPLNEIEDKIYKHEGKCYKFTPLTKKCDASKKNVSM